MKYLTFSYTERDVFNAMFAAVLNSDEPVIGMSNLRLNTKIIDVFDAVCEDTPSGKSLRVNPKGSVTIKFEDPEFDFLRPRVENTKWKSMHSKLAIKVIDKIGSYTTEEPSKPKLVKAE